LWSARTRRAAGVAQISALTSSRLSKLGDALRAEARDEASLELGDDLAGDRVDLSAARGGADEPCAAVGGIARSRASTTTSTTTCCSPDTRKPIGLRAATARRSWWRSRLQAPGDAC
jgi:hypothetical protein